MSATLSLASFYVLDRRIGTERFNLNAASALERIGAMSARSVRDASIERSAPWTSGSGYGGAPSSKMTLDAVPRPRCFDRGNVSALTAWLNSPAVTDALVWSVAPAAPTANRIGVIGVPDDARSGANALLEHYNAADDHYEVLRAALAKSARCRSFRPFSSTSAPSATTRRWAPSLARAQFSTSTSRSRSSR